MLYINKLHQMIYLKLKNDHEQNYVKILKTFNSSKYNQ